MRRSAEDGGATQHELGGPVERERPAAALAGDLEGERVGVPWAIRDTANVPTAPPENVAVKVATSSFCTGSRSSPSATPAACPTAIPSGTGRSFTAVTNVVPATDATGPQKNSPRSTRWLPMSASAPDPARRGSAS